MLNNLIKFNESKENVKDDNISLTELWKARKLKYGWYYIKHRVFESHTIDCLSPTNEWKFSNMESVIEVLSPVPSFEKLQSLTYDLELAKKNGQQWLEALQEDAKRIAELNKTIEELKHFDGKNVCAENEVLRVKIVELKNLLQESCVYLGYADAMSTNKENQRDIRKLVSKIDKAIGESEE